MPNLKIKLIKAAIWFTAHLRAPEFTFTLVCNPFNWRTIFSYGILLGHGHEGKYIFLQILGARLDFVYRDAAYMEHDLAHYVYEEVSEALNEKGWTLKDYGLEDLEPKDCHLFDGTTKDDI